MMKRIALLAIVAIVFAADLYAGVDEVGSRELWIPSDGKSIAVWHAPEAVRATESELHLFPIAQARIQVLRDGNAEPGIKALQIGLSRVLAEEGFVGSGELHWQPLAAGQVAVLALVSPEAEGLRLGLDLDGLADEAELRVAGSAFPELIYSITVAQARTQLDDAGLYWTPVTDGERQHLEFFHVDGGPVLAPVVAVSHLLVGLHGDADLGTAMKNSGSCNIDVACRIGTLGAQFESTKNAVARMVFSSGGSSFTCTGTLLNDTDAATTRLWFFSAHHCISTQSVANTLTTFWQNETPTCGSNQSGPNRQMVGGADLRYSSASTDALLLELRGSVPGPYTLAGWTSSPLSPAGTPVVAIHHPRGDRKKVSRGAFNRVASYNVSVPSSWRVNWNEGTTEGGSSGSGLFTLGANGYQLRGGLIGGAAGCDNEGSSDAAGNWDSYSRFDQVYPNIQAFLSPTGGASNGPSRDYTGQWDVAGEGGRGLSLFQFGNNTLFALWFVYDGQGRASWYQLDPTWTGADRASGPVGRWTGPAWGPTYNEANRSATVAGNFTLQFNSATSATFTYNVDGVSRTVTLRKL